MVANGFTRIELLAVIIITIILAAVVLPGFFGAEDKTREAAVKFNMRLVQRACESYATDSGGTYPLDANSAKFQCYFPGGNADQEHPAGGKWPVNPYTNLPESIKPGNVTDIQATRSKPPVYLGSAGSIYYNVIDHADPTAYAIQGAGKTGMALAGPIANSTLVLSNSK